MQYFVIENKTSDITLFITLISKMKTGHLSKSAIVKFHKFDWFYKNLLDAVLQFCY